MVLDTLPQAPDYERSVIGELIMEPEHIALARETGEELFYNPRYAMIFRALVILDIEGIPVDMLSVAEQLTRMDALDTVGGEEAIAGMVGEVTSAANIKPHIMLLKEKALLRQIITLTIEVRNLCLETSARPGEITALALEKVNEIRERFIEKRKSLTDEIREFIESTEVIFSSTDVNKYLEKSTKVNIRIISTTLGRLCKVGVIERTGNRHGFYRRVKNDCETIDFLSADEETLDVRWPLGLEEWVETMPGNIIVIAGEQNAGKTAFLLNFVKLNMARHEVWYFNSEMGAAELKKRLRKFDDLRIQDWRFNPRERSGDFHDVIRPDAFNVIDFLEIHDDFWKIGGLLKRIHDRLGHGIAVVAVQKNRDAEMGRGGSMGMEKPRMYLALKPGELTIVKGKNWAVENQNPNGKTFTFKLVQGAKFI